ncbi:hypothetical protein JCM8202v2_002262 [Rhodotorula sphaerocarpa]
MADNATENVEGPATPQADPRRDLTDLYKRLEAIRLTFPPGKTLRNADYASLGLKPFVDDDFVGASVKAPDASTRRRERAEGSFELPDICELLRQNGDTEGVATSPIGSASSEPEGGSERSGERPGLSGSVASTSSETGLGAERAYSGVPENLSHAQRHTPPDSDDEIGVEEGPASEQLPLQQAAELSAQGDEGAAISHQGDRSDSDQLEHGSPATGEEAQALAVDTESGALRGSHDPVRSRRLGPPAPPSSRASSASPSASQKARSTSPKPPSETTGPDVASGSTRQLRERKRKTTTPPPSPPPRRLKKTRSKEGRPASAVAALSSEQSQQEPEVGPDGGSSEPHAETTGPDVANGSTRQLRERKRPRTPPPPSPPPSPKKGRAKKRRAERGRSGSAAALSSEEVQPEPDVRPIGVSNDGEWEGDAAVTSDRGSASGDGYAISGIKDEQPTGKATYMFKGYEKNKEAIMPFFGDGFEVKISHKGKSPIFAFARRPFKIATGLLAKSQDHMLVRFDPVSFEPHVSLAGASSPPTATVTSEGWAEASLDVVAEGSQQNLRTIAFDILEGLGVFSTDLYAKWLPNSVWSKYNRERGQLKRYTGVYAWQDLAEGRMKLYFGYHRKEAYPGLQTVRPTGTLTAQIKGEDFEITSEEHHGHLLSSLIGVDGVSKFRIWREETLKQRE